MKILEKALGFDPKTMKLRTELIAGVTTFLTMSYILAVNPSILMTTGMSQGALFTATALASPGNGLFVAKLARHSAHRGHCIHLDNVLQRAGNDIQCHSKQPTLCHFGRYRYVHCLHWS